MGYPQAMQLGRWLEARVRQTESQQKPQGWWVQLVWEPSLIFSEFRASRAGVKIIRGRREMDIGEEERVDKRAAQWAGASLVWAPEGLQASPGGFPAL